MDSFSYSLSNADVVQHPRSLSHALQLRLTDITSDQEVNPPFNRSCHFEISRDCILSRREARFCVFGVLWLLGINLSVSDFGRIVSCLYRGGDAEVGGGSIFFVVANISRWQKDAGNERDSDERMIFDVIPRRPNMCPICLDGFKGAGLINNVIRTQCSHIFHRQCLQKWISNKKGTPDCPMCRAILV